MHPHRFLPRYSLRSLLVCMLVFCLATQAVVIAKQRRTQQRRDVLILDVQAQVIASQRMNLIYAERFLKLVQRRIVSETAILSAAEKRQLFHLVETEQANRRMAFRSTN